MPAGGVAGGGVAAKSVRPVVGGPVGKFPLQAPFTEGTALDAVILPGNEIHDAGGVLRARRGAARIRGQICRRNGAAAGTGRAGEPGKQRRLVRPKSSRKFGCEAPGWSHSEPVASRFQCQAGINCLLVEVQGVHNSTVSGVWSGSGGSAGRGRDLHRVEILSSFPARYLCRGFHPVSLSQLDAKPGILRLATIQSRTPARSPSQADPGRRSLRWSCPRPPERPAPPFPCVRQGMNSAAASQRPKSSTARRLRPGRETLSPATSVRCRKSRPEPAPSRQRSVVGVRTRARGLAPDCKGGSQSARVFRLPARPAKVFRCRRRCAKR